MTRAGWPEPREADAPRTTDPAIPSQVTVWKHGTRLVVEHRIDDVVHVAPKTPGPM
jgi:hypothetical protein